MKRGRNIIRTPKIPAAISSFGSPEKKKPYISAAQKSSIPKRANPENRKLKIVK